MKRIALIVSLVFGFVSYYFVIDTTKAPVDLSAYVTNSTQEFSFYVPSETENFVLEETTKGYNVFLEKNFVGFKEAVGFKESRGHYETVNKYGYLGKYQFAKATLRMIGINDPEAFLKDAHLQEKAFMAYASRNKWILRRDIKRFEGKVINGIIITESGILAAAHLGGAGNVKKYLRSGGEVGFNDAFGTSISYYLKKFSGYDTSNIKANRKARVL